MAQQISSYWKDTMEKQELPVLSLNGHSENPQHSDLTKLYISALRKKNEKTGGCKRASPIQFKVKLVSVFHGRPKKPL